MFRAEKIADETISEVATVVRRINRRRGAREDAQRDAERVEQPRRRRGKVCKLPVPAPASTDRFRFPARHTKKWPTEWPHFLLLRE